MATARQISATIDAARPERKSLVQEAGSTTSTTVTKTGGREVFGFMAIAVVFALVGNEIRHTKHPVALPVPGEAAASVLTDSGTIIFGGFTAAAVLTLVSHAGDGGRQLAVGLAAVTMLSSVLVYGGPVWRALGAATGASKPSRSSSPTSPSGARQSTPTPGTVGSTPYQII